MKLRRMIATCLVLAILAALCPPNLQIKAEAAGTTVASGTDGVTDYLTFALNSDGESYSVTDCSESASGELVIPATYNGKPVTSIGSSAFSSCSSLTSITIPDSVTSIGNGAFEFCSGLTSITIPDSVTGIIGGMFLECYNLTNVTIGDGVTGIDGYMFWDCTKLTNVTIGNSVTSIGVRAFHNCSSLTSITLPDSVTSISDYAFPDCRSLNSVIYCGTQEEWNAISIGDGNTSLTKATLQFHNYQNGVCTICGASAARPGDLIDAIPEAHRIDVKDAYSVAAMDEYGVAYVDDSNAYGGKAATYTVASDTLRIRHYGTGIAGGYEVRITDLVAADMTDTYRVYKIPYTVPAGSSAIDKLLLHYDWVFRIDDFDGFAKAEAGQTVDVYLSMKVTDNGNDTYTYYLDRAAVATPCDDCTTAGGSTCSVCGGSLAHSLVSVEGVEASCKPGMTAGETCTLCGYTTVEEIPAISDHTFTGAVSGGINGPIFAACDNGCGTKKIVEETFSAQMEAVLNSSHIIADQSAKDGDFASLIPSIHAEVDDPKAYGGKAFATYAKVTADITSAQVENFYTNGVDFGATGGNFIADAVHPSALIADGEYHIYKTSVTANYGTGGYLFMFFTRGFNVLPDAALLNSYNAVDIYFSMRIEGDPTGADRTQPVTYYVDRVVFAKHDNHSYQNGFCTGCDSTTWDYSIANGKVTITGYTGNETSLSIPNTIEGLPVTTIGDYAFQECTELTSVTIGNHVTSIGDWAFEYCTSLTSITIPDSVTSIGDGTFSDCSNLTSVIIGNNVTSIGDCAFQSCSSLTDITIPDSVTSIGEYAFWYCSNLTSITIPNSVTSIGDWAFEYCTSLTSITIPDSVTSIGDGTFSDCSNLTNVVYCGTSAQWNAISIDGYNTSLTEATLRFHSYVDNVCEHCGATVGIAVSGTITSFGDAGGEVTIKLFSGDTEVAAVTSTDGTYCLFAPAAGTYTLTVAKANHVTRTYEITVADTAITQDVKIHPIGDINGDGKVNAIDVTRANGHAKNTKLLTDYELLCADVSGDGKVNAIDVTRINGHVKKTKLLW